MDLAVFLAVLLAAALHAGWNAILKIDLDGFLSICLISLAAGAIALALVPFVAVPNAHALVFMAFSVVLHVGYNLFLVQAYRLGDLGQVYAIARGTAPMLVTLVMVGALGERLDPAALAGIALLTSGIFLMSLRGGRDLARLEGTAVVFALVTALFIAGYTVTDGLGARANGDAHGYAIWLFVADGLAMALILLARRGGNGLAAIGRNWRAGLAGGCMSLGAYWIAIWAATQAPIPLVAALRETSVLFAAAISALVLREPFTRWRALAAVVIVAGIALTRLG
jgi:drug/metabolite transporter (DMT)-like permease